MGGGFHIETDTRGTLETEMAASVSQRVASAAFLANINVVK